MNIICGIDVSSEWIDASLDGKQSRRFARNLEGFHALVRYSKGVSLYVMEATGRYHESLADHLWDLGLKVSVVNPARAAHYGRALGVGGKTDASDAQTLALYASRNPVPPYVPKTGPHRELQALVRARANVVEDRAKLKSQLKAPEMHESVKPLLLERLALCNAQVKQIESLIERTVSANAEFMGRAAALRTIPGVGRVTIWCILAEVQFELLGCAKAFAAYAGTNPREFISGKSVRKETRMSKRGNSSLRLALYMAALNAIRFEPFKSFYIRLLTKGKAKKAALGAVMNKLARTAYAVATRGLGFMQQAT